MSALDDLRGTGGGSCVGWSPANPLVASTRCAAAAQTIDPASLCSGAASCPVTASCRLTATGETYYPTVAPIGTSGASVIVSPMTSATLFSCLYTMSAGAAPAAQEIAPVPPPLRTSVGGARTIIGRGLPTGSGRSELLYYEIDSTSL